jgi:endonuclease YncB( thermonuclease family)
LQQNEIGYVEGNTYQCGSIARRRFQKMLQSRIKLAAHNRQRRRSGRPRRWCSHVKSSPPSYGRLRATDFSAAHPG